MKILLTPKQVAERLQIPRGSVYDLDIPRIRIGKGKGLYRYREDDVERYIAARVEYPEGSKEAHKPRKRIETLASPVWAYRAAAASARLSGRPTLAAKKKQDKKEPPGT